MRDGNNSIYNLLPNVLIVNFNVLHMLLKSKISSDEDNDLIITMHGLLGGR